MLKRNNDKLKAEQLARVTEIRNFDDDFRERMRERKLFATDVKTLPRIDSSPSLYLTPGMYVCMYVISVGLAFMLCFISP